MDLPDRGTCGIEGLVAYSTKKRIDVRLAGNKKAGVSRRTNKSSNAAINVLSLARSSLPGKSLVVVVGDSRSGSSSSESTRDGNHA